jgi:hypothetical protein
MGMVSIVRAEVLAPLDRREVEAKWQQCRNRRRDAIGLIDSNGQDLKMSQRNLRAVVVV